MMERIETMLKGPFQKTLISIGKFLNDNGINFENCTKYLKESEENQIIVLDFICSLGEKLKTEFAKESSFLPIYSKKVMDDKIDKKIKKNENLFTDDDNLKNCIIMHYFCSYFDYNNIRQYKDNYPENECFKTAISEIEYLSHFSELIFEYYCEKNKKIHDGYEPLKNEKDVNMTIENIVYNDDQYNEVNNKPGNYYVEHKNINYKKKTPEEIYEHITNYLKMEQINSIKCTKSTAVGHTTSGAATYKINDNRIGYPEYKNVIFKKIEGDPKEGGKRRKSRRNRKSKKGKKSRKARKSRRKSKSRR